MKALVEAADSPDFPAEIALVVSNDPMAAGLNWAQARGIATLAVDHKPFGKDRAAHERQIDHELRMRDIGFICLAGYMRVLTPFLVESWAGKMINIHPSLLPEFKGLHTHERVLEAGATEHGCSVHWVTPGVDEGEIIAQARVQVIPGDTADSLAARVLEQEHSLYPSALKIALAAL